MLPFGHSETCNTVVGADVTERNYRACSQYIIMDRGPSASLYKLMCVSGKWLAVHKLRISRAIP